MKVLDGPSEETGLVIASAIDVYKTCYPNLMLTGTSWGPRYGL